MILWNRAMNLYVLRVVAQRVIVQVFLGITSENIFWITSHNSEKLDYNL